MKVIVMKECCLALEAAEVVTRYINQESYQETQRKFLMRYGARFTAKERQKFIDKMTQIEQIYEEIAGKLSRDPMTEFLFRKCYYGNTYSVLGQIMLINFQDIRISSIEGYLDSCKARWRSTKEKKVHLKSVQFSALVFEPGEEKLKDCLMQDIDQLDCPCEFKWNLLKVLHDFDYYIEEMKRILGALREELPRALQKLDAVTEEMKGFWKQKLSLDVLEEMAASMGISGEKVREKTVILQLLRMACDQAVIDEAWSEKKLPLCLGICIEWGNQFEDDQIDRQLLCEKLRIFSEESKFEILLLLKNEGSYGQEIARRVGLDAATVSRHLTVLQRHGLIYIERKEGRNIYYRTNQREIRNLMELMQKIFLRPLLRE